MTDFCTDLTDEALIMNSDCTGRLEELKPMITTFSSSLEMLEELHKGVTRNSSPSGIGCHS